MGCSVRTFLITPGDNIRKIGKMRYWDMLGAPDSHRLPESASQRVQLATLTIELVDRKPVRVLDRDFAIVTFDAQGSLDVDQIMQRAGAPFEVFATSIPTLKTRVALRRLSTQRPAKLYKAANGRHRPP